MGHSRFLENLYPAIDRLGLGKFVRHYVAPFLERREKGVYDAQKFFESWHKSIIDQEFSDRITIRPDHDLIDARYHYNSVENAILEGLKGGKLTISRPDVLDIGSGAGHWISFYLDTLDARSVVGTEISRPCVDALGERYRSESRVRIAYADISSPSFNISTKFDIVNAIGVMFHIVDDEDWSRAIKNIAHCLNDGGLFIVGGQFGYITRDVQFHNTDDFDKFPSWSDVRNNRTDRVLINKRIRSMRRWKKVAVEAGFKIQVLIKTRQFSGMITPENNVLILTKERGEAGTAR